MEATRILARYITETRYEDLSERVIWEAKRRTADVLSIGLSGSKTDLGKSIQDFAEESSPKGSATLWGSRSTVAPEFAAFANATMTYQLELDDCHRTSHAHPGISIIPAALALCEEKKLDAKAFLTAIVIGYEVVTSVGMAVSPSIYVDRVFLAPGTLAPLGGSAVAAKLYGLSTEETEKVLGAAAFFSPLALFEAFAEGALVKNTAMGWGALVGIWAARLCSHGFSGPVTAIEGKFGYAKAVSDKYNLQKIVDSVQHNRGIVNTGLKPYACCRQHHSAVDAILELKEKYGLKPQDVKHIVVRTFGVASRGSQKRPDTIASATYSIPFIMATVLTTGSCWRDQFTIDRIHNSELLNLAEKVDAVKDDELDALYDEKWPAIVEVQTNDGRVLSARRDIPKGEPEFAVSDDELKAKFMSLTSDAIDIGRAEALWQEIFNLEKADSVSELTDLLPISR